MLRRLFRRWFTPLSAASLVLCFATCVLWVRSCWVAEGVSRVARSPGDLTQRLFEAWSGAGSFSVSHVTATCGDRPAYNALATVWVPAEWAYHRRPAGPAHPTPIAYGGTTWRAAGFSYARHVYGNARLTHTARDVRVPYWAVALAAACLPATWHTRRRRLRRLAMVGRCPGCGYDLRATPDAGGALLARCPECGAVPAMNMSD